MFTWLRKLLNEQNKVIAIEIAGWQAGWQFVRSCDIVLGHA